MNLSVSGQITKAEQQDMVTRNISTKAKSKLSKFAAWISDRNIPFFAHKPRSGSYAPCFARIYSGKIS